MKKICLVLTALMFFLSIFTAYAAPTDATFLKKLDGSQKISMNGTETYGMTLDCGVTAPQKDSTDVCYHYTGTATADLIGGYYSQINALSVTSATLSYPKVVYEGDIMIKTEGQGVMLRTSHWNAAGTAFGGATTPFTLIAGEDIDAGKWYKVAVEFDSSNSTGTETSSNFTVFINGVVYKTGNVPAGYFAPRYMWFSPYLKKGMDTSIYFDNFNVYGCKDSYNENYTTASFDFTNSDFATFNQFTKKISISEATTVDQLLSLVNSGKNSLVTIYKETDKKVTSGELNGNETLVIYDKDADLISYTDIDLKIADYSHIDFSDAGKATATVTNADASSSFEIANEALNIVNPISSGTDGNFVLEFSSPLRISEYNEYSFSYDVTVKNLEDGGYFSFVPFSKDYSLANPYLGLGFFTKNGELVAGEYDSNNDENGSRNLTYKNGLGIQNDVTYRFTNVVNKETNLVTCYINGNKIYTYYQTDSNYPKDSINGFRFFGRTMTGNMYYTVDNVTVNRGSGDVCVNDLQIYSTDKGYVVSGNATNFAKNSDSVNVIAAVYGYNNNIIDVKFINVSTPKIANNFVKLCDFSTVENSKYVKAFAFNNMQNFKPICKAATQQTLGNEVKINPETVRLVGRYAPYQDGGYSCTWPQSGIEFKFTGEGVDVHLSNLIGTIYLNASIDGNEECYRFKTIRGWNKIAEGLEYGDHTIKLTLSSEGTLNKIALDKLRIHGDGITTPTTEKARTMEFIGDSYTVGYGNLAYGKDQPNFTQADTDAWRSYAGYCARALDADVNVVAFSGKGLCMNGNKSTTLIMPQQYDYAEPRTVETIEYPKWSFENYTPDVIVIFLGRNDHAGSDPEGSKGDVFKAAYIEFLKTLKEKNPNATIVACSRPTVTYAEEAAEAIKELGGKDSDLYHFVFTKFGNSGVHSHPYYTEDKDMGDELAEFINSLGTDIWN